MQETFNEKLERLGLTHNTLGDFVTEIEELRIALTKACEWIGDGIGCPDETGHIICSMVGDCPPAAKCWEQYFRNIAKPPIK